MQVKERTLKNIETKNKLESRLKEKGYILIEKIKEGRKVYYTLEQKEEQKELYNNIVKNYYKTNKEREFTNYFQIRTDNDAMPLNKKELGQVINISSRTISRWDNNLIDKSIIAKDGFFYFSINKETKEIQQCTQEEYKNFWKNKGYTKAFKELQLKYINGQITLTELQLSSAEIGNIITLIEDKYYYRIKKYKTNKDNKMYIDTINLIKYLDTYK